MVIGPGRETDIRAKELLKRKIYISDILLLEPRTLA